MYATSQKATLEVDRFARHKCPLLEIAAIALQQGHVAMGHIRTLNSQGPLQVDEIQAHS